MNTVLLIGLAVCEIFFAAMFVYEIYCLMRWLDRRVLSPLLSKVNDLILSFYVRHLTEEWLFWERRREGNGAGIDGPPGESAESAGEGP